MLRTKQELLNEFSNKNRIVPFFNYFHPIVGMKKDKISNLYGTCLYLNNNIFVTASHVIENISNEETKLLLIKKRNGWVGNEIIECESFKFIDICIFKINSIKPKLKQIKWTIEDPSILTDVYACGYPHGFSPESQNVQNRGLKGSIAGINQYDIYEHGKFFNAIEIDFSCPKGLSGSPLIGWDNFLIYGIVTGNTSVSIITHEKRELNEINGERSYYCTEETHNLGLAIANQSIFGLHSNILGSQFLEYLKKNKLLNNE